MLSLLHTAKELTAVAVCQLFPDTLLCGGVVSEIGFSYTFFFKKNHQLSDGDLRRVEEQIQQLRNAGAEIIVQEKDYIIVSTENVAQTLDLRFEAISESDLVQRFVHVLLTDRSELQQVVNSGMDYWELKGDTVVGRAFDVQIEQLRKEGFTVDIIAQNASAREEK